MNFFDKFKKKKPKLVPCITPIIFVIDKSNSVSQDQFELTATAIIETCKSFSFAEIEVAIFEFSSYANCVTKQLVAPYKATTSRFVIDSEANFNELFNTLNNALSDKQLFIKAGVYKNPIICFITNGITNISYSESLDSLKKNPLFDSANKIAITIGNTYNSKTINDIVGDCGKAIHLNSVNEFKPKLNEVFVSEGIKIIPQVCPSQSFSISQDENGYYIPKQASYQASVPISPVPTASTRTPIAQQRRAEIDLEILKTSVGRDTRKQEFDYSKIENIDYSFTPTSPTVVDDPFGPDDYLPPRVSDFDSDEACSTCVIEDDNRSDFDYSDASREILIPPIAQQVTPTPTVSPKFCYACGSQLQPSTRFCPMCGAQIPTITPNPAGTRPSMESVSKPLEISTVQFSALAPKEFIKGRYTMVNITLYEEEYRAVVDQIIQSAESEVREVVGSPLMLKAKTFVTIRLDSPDVKITDCVGTQAWIGKFLNFDFPIEVPSDFAKSQILFVATVYFNNVIATKLKFIAKARSVKDQKMSLLREDVLSAFVSYARQDIDLVTATIQGMRKARPDMEIFLDIDMLRSGEKWENVLKSEIEQRDILYLFWSSNARASEWVDKEWRYALDNKGIDCIEPIPLDTPEKCPPPSELNALHFNDRYLLYRNKENRSSDGI